jgi:neutral ceramidase
MAPADGWTAASDSPLLPFIDAPPRRARFTDRPVAPKPLPLVDSLLAGAVDVDITPPPGMPKAGYSANAHHGSGFRTRLRARVLHLRAGGTSLALVQCDLLGGSSVVHHLVARAIADHTDVPLAGLMIGATHTHAGPGQYLGTDFYNRFASNRSGFDPAFAQFLVERISDGIIEAVATRRPAQLAFGSTEVWGLTRNRSLNAHVRNRSVEDTSTAPQRKFWSVNPQLHLLRVDEATDRTSGGTQPMGAMVIFSVHGTGVPMKAHEYNADIWAYLVGELGHRIEASTGHQAVVGAVEGTHADVAPAIRPGTAGHLEAARLGRAIGAEAAELYEQLATSLRTDVTLGAGLREVELEKHPSIGAVTLPRRPAVGAALIGGAHENVTPIVHKVPPFGPGRPKRFGRPHPQGPKWVIGSRWLQPIVLPLRSFPRVLPVQTIRIGDAVVVGLPFEVTVESGRLIADEVDKAIAASDATRVIVSSVANEYCGYAATADEYELQHYEGAHTLYGPNTQAFLAAHAAELAGVVVRAAPESPSLQEVPAERSFDLRVHRHLPRPEASTPARRLLGHARFVDPTRTADGYWEVEWCDVAPANLHWHEPLVRVEASDGDGWFPATHHGVRVDDQGSALQVTHHGADASGEHRYSVRWWNPLFQGGRSHRFVLLANNGRPEVASAPFH